MCHFVTATLPASAPHAALDALARQHGRQFKRLHSEAVERQLGAGVGYFITTLGHCDCGTSLGASHRREARQPEWADEEKKLVRKGWSKAKVARAIAQKRECVVADQANARLREAEDIARWERFVLAVLQSGFASEIGLLLHGYSGPLDEPFQLAGQHVVPATVPLPEILRSMSEDVLHVFRAKA